MACPAFIGSARFEGFVYFRRSGFGTGEVNNNCIARGVQEAVHRDSRASARGKPGDRLRAVCSSEVRHREEKAHRSKSPRGDSRRSPAVRMLRSRRRPNDIFSGKGFWKKGTAHFRDPPLLFMPGKEERRTTKEKKEEPNRQPRAETRRPVRNRPTDFSCPAGSTSFGSR